MIASVKRKRKPLSWWTRQYALHTALIVRRRGNALTLFERYGDRTKIGTFRTWSAVERAIVRYGDEVLAGKRHPLGATTGPQQKRPRGKILAKDNSS
jgi:hypothetical protein